MASAAPTRKRVSCPTHGEFLVTAAAGAVVSCPSCGASIRLARRRDDREHVDTTYDGEEPAPRRSRGGRAWQAPPRSEPSPPPPPRHDPRPPEPSVFLSIVFGLVGLLGRGLEMVGPSGIGALAFLLVVGVGFGRVACRRADIIEAGKAESRALVLEHDGRTPLTIPGELGGALVGRSEIQRFPAPADYAPLMAGDKVEYAGPGKPARKVCFLLEGTAFAKVWVLAGPDGVRYQALAMTGELGPVTEQ